MRIKFCILQEHRSNFPGNSTHPPESQSKDGDHTRLPEGQSKDGDHTWPANDVTRPPKPQESHEGKGPKGGRPKRHGERPVGDSTHPPESQSKDGDHTRPAIDVTRPPKPKESHDGKGPKGGRPKRHGERPVGDSTHPPESQSKDGDHTRPAIDVTRPSKPQERHEGKGPKGGRPTRHGERPVGDSTHPPESQSKDGDHTRPAIDVTRPPKPHESHEGKGPKGSRPKRHGERPFGDSTHPPESQSKDGDHTWAASDVTRPPKPQEGHKEGRKQGGHH